jgi:hypothetical protein
LAETPNQNFFHKKWTSIVLAVLLTSYFIPLLVEFDGFIIEKLLKECGAFYAEGQV